MDKRKAPIFVLPKDEKKRQKLQKLLDSCKQVKRILPRLRCSAGINYPIIIIERLIRDGKVNIWKLVNELTGTKRFPFGTTDFNDVCIAIAKILKED